MAAQKRNKASLSMATSEILYGALDAASAGIRLMAKWPVKELPNADEKQVSTWCVGCDMSCDITVTVRDGKVIKMRPKQKSTPAICAKCLAAPEVAAHKDRITKPLKNIGSRAEPQWQEISWEQALDEIAEKLGSIKSKYGAESLAVAHMPVNTQNGMGVVRRFMNAFGTPNYISPLDLCVGNTAQVHRLVYGWYTDTNFEMCNCIVYFGQVRTPDHWAKEYHRMMKAVKKGAKLIAVDPRETEITRMADYHLKIRYGTDAALLLAWLNVIIEEGLYNKHFVKHMTVGFDKLRARVREYPPERVAEICGVDAGLIRETARVYAKSMFAAIPWTVNTDMQKNSTSAILCQCILRAICGHINSSELVPCPGKGAHTISEIEMHDHLSPKQKAKQLGAEDYPLFSYKTLELYKEASLREFRAPYFNLCDLSAIAHPPAVFRAMRTGDPYPVKAFFAFGTNPLMNYANQKGIYEALMNQELVVTYDIFMSPTAQLSDYVLPSDMWLERDAMGFRGGLEVVPTLPIGCAAIEPRGECKGIYDVIKGLADRLDLGAYFPWADLHAFYDWILAPTGITFERAKRLPVLPLPTKSLGALPSVFLKPASKGTGFATPSGKVELYSSILELLGYDPLPSFTEPDPLEQITEYPLVFFVGKREKGNYNTGLRQIMRLRRFNPEPELLLHPADVARYGLADGQWAWVETTVGRIQLLTRADSAQPEGTARVPHGWWKPELPQGAANGLSGAMLHNDAVLIPDSPDNLDPIQGLPNLRGGIRCKVYPVA